MGERTPYSWLEDSGKQLMYIVFGIITLYLISKK
jgi:hypothetical protein